MSILAHEKIFLITVDTEGDNLWNWKDGQPIMTENSTFIPRFQELCEEYGFRPTYLTNYEMAMDDRWVAFGKEKARAGLCEIGMHIHAWNSPPKYILENQYGGNPYITEYPDSVINEKVSGIVNVLRERFDLPIISSRSGRWATDKRYFSALVKSGIKVDCSVTPDMDLSDIPGCNLNCGNDYTSVCKDISEIYPGLLEIPMTTRKVRWASEGPLKHTIKSLLFGDYMWLRPIYKSLTYLKKLTCFVEKEKVNYLEFMVHSSELMPGGSPYFKNECEIEVLYEVMNNYFHYLVECGYTGLSIAEYAQKRRGITE